MRGTWDSCTNIYMLNLTQEKKLMTESTNPDKYFAGSAYECKSKSTLVEYHHASCWSPTHSGWGKAITKNFSTSWPGLSTDLVHKHINKKINHTWVPPATAKGPQINTRKGNAFITRSGARPVTKIHAVRKHQSCLLQDSGSFGENVYDQTGRSPVTSSKGNKYILVTYNYYSNTIHAEPLKTRSGLDLTSEYQKLHSLLINRALRPHLHILDNEFPNVLKVFMREVTEKFQLVPPHIHCRNSAERAIRTFNEHFIAEFSSTHKDFPLHIWCQLIPHAIIMLKLLRQLRMNPKISGYAQLHGEFNYDTTPLVPPDTQVIIHENPTVRGMWQSHWEKGWYLGPSMNHYICHHVYVTKRRGKRDSDCVEFFPHNTPLPFKYSAENGIIAARELAYALKNPAPQAPFSNIRYSQLVAIEQLSNIFTNAAENVKSAADPPQQ